MRSFRFFCWFAILAYAIFITVPIGAQSNAVVPPDRSSTLSGPQIPAAPSQPVAGQKTKLRFGAALAYDSGGPYADSVAVADLNGDGRLDLIVANYCQSAVQGSCNTLGEVAVLISNGNGTFQPAVTYSTGAYYAYSVAVGDLNGDGVPDIVVSNLCESVNPGFVCDTGSPGEVSVLLGKGDGTFQPAVTYGSGGFYATSVTVGDLNGDGKPDLVVANGGYDVGSVSTLLGNGDGTFQPAVSYSSGAYGADSVVMGDLIGDGRPDLVVASLCQGPSCSPGGGYDGELGVLVGNGDGTLQPAVTYNSGGEYAYSVALGDLRGNGILDLVVANKFSDDEGSSDYNAVDVLLGNGDGTFQSAVSYLLPGGEYDAVAIGDVNGDGYLDLVLVEECQRLTPHSCKGTGEVAVLLGNGDGTFQKPIVYPSGGYEGSAIAIGDVNGDGRPDLIVTNACGSGCGADGTVAVLLNETYYASKTALAASPNPSHVNQSVTFTATITPGVPNGEVVTFYNGGTKLGTGTTASGVATLTTSFSKAGKHTIKAAYPGDAFRKPSSGTVKQVVKQ